MAKTKEKAKQVLVIRDDATGLALSNDGQSVIIENEKDARRAIAFARDNQLQIDKLRRKLARYTANNELMRKGLRNYQVEHQIVEIKHEGWISQLIERTASMWIFSERDIPRNMDITELDEPVKPLFDILKAKFPDIRRRSKIINKITRRIVEPAELDELVKKGTLSAEEVAPAFLQYIDTAYVQIKPVTKNR